jgi:hypothetical protein
MPDEFSADMPASGSGSVESEPYQMPHTRWPTIAGVAMIIAMILLLFSAWIFYYNAEYVEDMSGSGPITGVLKEDREDKRIPLKDVNISVEGLDIWTYSDSSGYYELDNVPAGKHRFKFEKPGYETVIVKDIVFSKKDLDASNVESNNISIPGNLRGGQYLGAFEREIEFQELSLENGTVSGSVVDESNNALAGANVTYIDSKQAALVSSLPPTLVDTGQSGDFSFDSKPGRYLFNVSLNGYVTLLQEVFVSPGNTTDISFVLEAGSGVNEKKINETREISGSVKNADGEPIKSVAIEVEGTDISATTGPDGEYTLENVPIGSRTLRVSRIGYSLVSSEKFLEDDAEADFKLEYLGEEFIDNSDVSAYYYCSVTYIVIALLLLAGGIMALKRKNYGIALIASALGIGAGIYFYPLIQNCIAIILCVIALVFVFISRREFT